MKMSRTMSVVFLALGVLTCAFFSSCAEKEVAVVDFELSLFSDDEPYAAETRNFSFRSKSGDVFERVTDDGETVVDGDFPLEASEDSSGVYRASLPAGEYRLFEDGEDTGAFFALDPRHDRGVIYYCSSVAYASNAILLNSDCAGVYVIIKDRTFVTLASDNPLLAAINGVKSPVSLDIADCPNMTMGYRAFYGADNLVSFVPSADMSSLGRESFAFCSSLYRLEIPDSVVSFEGGALEGCTSLEEIEVSPRNRAFYAEHGVLFDKNRRSLLAWPSAAGNIVLPPEVQLVSEYCFAGCSSLLSVVMPGVQNVKHHAFRDCRSLASVEFSAPLESLDRNVFEHCFLLSDIKMNGERGDYSASKGMIFSDGGTVLYAWPGAQKSIVIPDTVTRIDDCAFQNQQGLIQVTMGSSVREIGSQAFSSCTDLSAVVMPSVAIIESYAFERCTSLRQIQLPANLRRCDGGAFAECSSLSSISVQEGNRSYAAVNGAIYSADMKTLVEWPAASGSVTVPESVETVASYAFNRNYGLKKVVLKNVKSLGHHAFDDCTSLSDVTLNEGLTSIGTHAFSKCLSLKKLVIPASVDTVKNYAFWFWTQDQTVAVRQPSKPAGWDFGWDADCDANVVWSYEE